MVSLIRTLVLWSRFGFKFLNSNHDIITFAIENKVIYPNNYTAYRSMHPSLSPENRSTVSLSPSIPGGERGKAFRSLVIINPTMKLLLSRERTTRAGPKRRKYSEQRTRRTLAACSAFTLSLSLSFHPTRLSTHLLHHENGEREREREKGKLDRMELGFSALSSFLQRINADTWRIEEGRRERKRNERSLDALICFFLL